MNNSVFHVLQLILNDISKNQSQFNQSNLEKAISQFQNKVLNSRKKDSELKTVLQQLSIKQISEISNKLNIYLLSPPKQKNTLASLINSLILQTKKKEAFLQLIKPILSSKKVSKAPKKRKQMKSISTSDYENYRKTWLTSANPSQLGPQLLNIKMNELRGIVKPWRVRPKTNTKNALIEAIINYIIRMKRLTKLGT